jgi:hypothetical protein
MSWWGLVVYGCLVAALEFLPLGGINPKDVAEYFSAVRGRWEADGSAEQRKRIKLGMNALP